VVALDGSQQMLEQLRSRLGDQEGRLQALWQDLREPFDVDGPFDAVLSVATLHWLHDHEHVFAELARVVRPGGHIVIEAGGHGNIAGFLRAVSSVQQQYDGRHFWNFADVQQTRTRLAAAGFDEIAVRLVPDEARFEDRAQLEAFVATVMLAAALRDMSRHDGAALVAAVCDQVTEPAIDFVRLQIEARCASGDGEAEA
jgi:trans-aconitate 2-methyltransferase